MKRVEVRFYAELNDFLPLWRRKRPTTCDFGVSGSVKDMIEALGVPHTEVDLILANDESVDFSYRIQDGDKISVYPVFESIDISSLVRLRPAPLREVRFIADVHLGRLAAYLSAHARVHRDHSRTHINRVSALVGDSLLPASIFLQVAADVERCRAFLFFRRIPQLVPRRAKNSANFLPG